MIFIWAYPIMGKGQLQIYGNANPWYDAGMKLILDIDTGIDDALAIAYTLANSQIELLGCTCTFGNVQATQSARNTLAILHLLGRDDIPVYVGDSHPWGQKSYRIEPSSEKFHGKNGLGDIEIEDSPRKPEKKSADEFLVESVEKYGTELSIVTTGPVADLASFVLNHPTLRSKMGPLTMMGGSLLYGGNATSYAEANFLHDVKAAKFLLSSSIRKTMVGLDVTETVNLTKEDADKWETMGKKGKTFASLLRFYLSRHADQTRCFVHDPTSVVCALHKEWFTFLPVPLTVIQEGEMKGMTIGSREVENPTDVAVSADRQTVEEDLRSAYERIFR
jgi:purine nucleosidase